MYLLCFVGNLCPTDASVRNFLKLPCWILEFPGLVEQGFPRFSPTGGTSLERYPLANEDLGGFTGRVWVGGNSFLRTLRTIYPGYPLQGMWTTFWFSRVPSAGTKTPAFPLLRMHRWKACWARRLSMPRHDCTTPVLQTPVFRIGAVRPGRVQVALATATSHPCVSGTRGTTTSSRCHRARRW